MVHSETGSQLYLIIPADVSRDAVVRFAESGCFGGVAFALLRPARDGKVDRGLAGTLLRFARDADIPLLVEHDIAAAAELGAGGVHIAASEELYTRARNALGGDAIVGAECGLSRHTGLTLGEMGADYIAFRAADGNPGESNDPELEDMIGWWSQYITVPCVAWDIESVETARRLSEAGADFIAVGDPVWTDAEGPARAAAQFSAALARERASA
jgi:thiamine-phosphate pyrophosphorylase